jgi:hypothetical protein
MATKKEATKKRATTKKATTKKTTKKVVKEEKIVKEPVEELIELTKSDEPIVEVKNEEPIVVEETEVMNGDPAVLTPIEEEVEIEETPKEEKPKITKRISKIFTYLWNGQMIDF